VHLQVRQGPAATDQFSFLANTVEDFEKMSDEAKRVYRFAV
jgi:hypothetical protein